MKVMKKIYVIFAILVLASVQMNAQVPQLERDALVALYDSTSGDTWSKNDNWKTGDPCDNHWFGVVCDFNQVTVLKLDLSFKQLSGVIPKELGNLQNLAELILDSNQLSGSIPKELGNLQNLTRLILQDNQLSGSIPTSLGNLDHLIDLILFNNQLTGSIPYELGNLKSLKILWLHQNQLSGSIPTSLGSLSNLEDLFLDGNQLSGSIPPELGSLSRAGQIRLNNNHLQGEIPSSLTALSSNLANQYGLWMTENCSLHSEDSDIQALIIEKGYFINSYEDFLATQGNCENTITPVIMYLLN